MDFLPYDNLIHIINPTRLGMIFQHSTQDSTGFCEHTLHPVDKSYLATLTPHSSCDDSLFTTAALVTS